MADPSLAALAEITPVEPSQSRRVMNGWTIARNSIYLILFQTSWLWFAALGVLAMQWTLASAAMACATIAIALLALQCFVVVVYPEWPINGWLCNQLRLAINDRTNKPDWVCDDSRVVELVPRERWDRASFETATDLLLIHVDESGVRLEGDCHRYNLPADSILGADLHILRPPGWITSTAMVIIIAKTDQGPIELPISYRDHGYGSLLFSARQSHAIELADAISRIAKGDQFQPIENDIVPFVLPVSTNPYAAPRTI